MRKKTLFICFSTLLFSASVAASECVVLLHGLARTSNSMALLENVLESSGYYVVNVDYPSRTLPVKALAEQAVGEGLNQCRIAAASPINFVTHSLGGILVRQYYRDRSVDEVQRVIMLGPPNKGSEVVDHLKDLPGFELINGPAGMQLGTQAGDIPNSLGAVKFELGVIAGTRSINLLLSNYLPNPDDGKVSVESTKVAGMCSFLALPTSHPFMMKNERVIDAVKHYLTYGWFKGEAAINVCMQ